MRAALALLFLTALSSQLSGQTPVGPAASIVGTWHGSSICVDRVHDPACRDEEVIYRVDSVAGPNGPVRMVADKVVSGAQVNMGAFHLQYDTTTHVWFQEFQTRLHGLWNFQLRGNEMSGTLIELPSRRLIRRVTVQRAS